MANELDIIIEEKVDSIKNNLLSILMADEIPWSDIIKGLSYKNIKELSIRIVKHGRNVINNYSDVEDVPQDMSYLVIFGFKLFAINEIERIIQKRYKNDKEAVDKFVDGSYGFVVSFTKNPYEIELVITEDGIVSTIPVKMKLK